MTVADDVQRVLQERAQALASRRAVDDGDRADELHLVARVGDRSVGISAAATRHVVPATPLTTLVDCGPAITGLAAVKGELVPVADLGALLQIERTTGRTRSSHFVVIDDGEHALALLVDEVEGMRNLDISETGSEHAPESVVTGLIRRVIGDTYVLDLPAVLADDRGWPAADDRASV